VPGIYDGVQRVCMGVGSEGTGVEAKVIVTQKVITGVMGRQDIYFSIYFSPPFYILFHFLITLLISFLSMGILRCDSIPSDFSYSSLNIA